MKFLNKNTFFTKNQELSVVNLFNEIGEGKYNTLLNKYLKNSFNICEIGFKSGWFLYYASQQTEGKCYGMELPNNIIPTIQDTIMFNNISNVGFKVVEDIVEEVKSFVDNYDVDIIVNTHYPTLSNEIKEIVKDKNIILFDLVGKDFVLFENKQQEIKKEVEKIIEETMAVEVKQSEAVEETASELEKVEESKEETVSEDSVETSTETTSAKTGSRRRKRRKTTE